MRRIKLSHYLLITLTVCLIFFASPMRATIPVSNCPHFPRPVAYWSFDYQEGSTVFDDTYGIACGHDGGLNATLYGGAFLTAGKYGKACYFDGVNDKAEITNDSRLNFETAFTISAWVKPISVTGAQTIINKWYRLDSYMLSVQNGQYTFSVVLQGRPPYYVDVSSPASANVWTHVAGVYNYDESRVELYINGVQVASQSASGPIQQSSQNVVIGNHPSWNAFTGYIDEVRLYNTALDSDQIERLAVNPSNLDVRGIHLYAEGYVSQTYGNAWPKFKEDLNYIEYIRNINFLKTTIYTFLGDPNRDTIWLEEQNKKLSFLKSAAGNHVTWIIRAWPAGADFVENMSWFDRGLNFAKNLAEAFWQIDGPYSEEKQKYSLNLQNVYIEVGNEPNHPENGFGCSMSAYNDFFRGFYYGQQQVGYNFPLVYAGLCGNPDYNPDSWYNDYWVRYHIQYYAQKIGVHVYWQNYNGERTDPCCGRGKYYRTVQSILSNYGMSYKGIFITEFNGNRSSFPYYPSYISQYYQIGDVCTWWRELDQDRTNGYWVEGSTLFITNYDDNPNNPNDDNFDDWYVMTDLQLPYISNCNK